MDRRKKDVGPPTGVTERRTPIPGDLIAVSPKQLRHLVNVRWWQIVAIAALAGVFAGSGLWFITSKNVEGTVRKDVRHASVFNCNRTNKSASAGKAVRDFLNSDALLNEQLGHFDAKASDANQALSIEIARLGNLIPRGISKAYTRLSVLYDTIAKLRIKAARLWAGPPRKTHGKRKKSLSASVLLVAQAPCDKIIKP